MRGLAIGEINKRPGFRTVCQVFPYGIKQNIIRLLPAAFLVSQPVFKEITLPAYTHGFGRPFFPFADDELDGFVGWRKGNQRVNMIGHEQKDIRPPKTLLLPMPDRFKEWLGDLVGGQLIRSTQFAIDGNEVNLPLRINPWRNFVRQRFPKGNGHAKMLGPRVEWRNAEVRWLERRHQT